MTRTDAKPSLVTWVNGLPEIQTARLFLRIARSEDVDAIVAFVRRNREHLRPWEPSRTEDYFRREHWLDVPDWETEHALRGTMYRFRLFEAPDKALRPDRVIGTVSLRDIAGTPLKSGVLGYTVDKDMQGKGLATEAASAAVEFAFRVLGLCKLKATYLPHNAASARVLAKLGFAREERMIENMQVNGFWQDHYVSTCVNPKWRSASESKAEIY